MNATTTRRRTSAAALVVLALLLAVRGPWDDPGSPFGCSVADPPTSTTWP